jgi:nucleotide-binding universal stress UspA family protein
MGSVPDAHLNRETAMLRIERILFPTDFSDCANAAFPGLLHYAKKLGAQMHSLHVVALPEHAPLYPEWGLAKAEEVFESLRDRAVTEMAKLCQAYSVDAAEMEIAQRRATAPAPAILEYAQEHRIDLILMATHGRRGLPSR